MKLLIVNGPNMNMLGVREPTIYGFEAYDALCSRLLAHCASLGVEAEIYQSNHEGCIIDKIQSAFGNTDGIVINPAAYTHTSIAIRDALTAVAIPVAEVHISDVSSREGFRAVDFIRDICAIYVAGHGTDGYLEAIDALCGYIRDAV